MSLTSTPKPDLAALTIEEYAEEYLRSQNRIRRGVDFLHGLVQRPPALFHGLLPERTVTMISAEPFCGKTMLTLAMALSLDSGQPLAGKFTPRDRHRVLYLGQDAPTWDYAEQFRKLGRGMSVNPDLVEIDFLLNEGGSLTDRTFLAGLQAWHEEVGYSVIIFDTLAAFHDLDENDSRQMGAIMAILKKLRDKLACTVIFTHHTRKPSPDGVVSANYAARGSSVIAGSIDFHIALHRSSGNRIRLSLPKGRGSEKLGPEAGFYISEGDSQAGPWVKLTQEAP